MKKFFFFAFIGLILFALWANHVWGDEKKGLENPAANLPEVPVLGAVKKPVLDLKNPAADLPNVQAPPPYEISDFSGGLNTRSRIDALAPNEAAVLTNFLLNTDGELTVRPGFAKVNASMIAKKPIWGLYHYSIPGYGKGFLVGDSIFIYKMADDGTFADSQIYMDELQGDFASGDSRVNIDQPVDFFNLERKICRGDKVAFGSTEYEIKQVVYDTTATAAFKLELTGAASATASNQTFRIRAANATVSKASFLQRNNTVFFSMGGRQNGRWNGKLGDMVGIYGQGKIDTVYFNGAGGPSRRDTAIVCNSCNFSTNELQNKVLAFSAVTYNGRYDSTRRIVTHYRIVLSNTSGSPSRIYYQSTHLDSGVQVGRLQPFLIFNPVYTVVDSGTIDTISNEGSAQLFRVRDAGKNFSDKHIYSGKIIEFLDGAARGVTLVIDGGVRGALGDTLRMISTPTAGFDSTSLPKKGDKYAIYHLGLQAAITELYYDRLICAGIPNFPNTIRPSETGNPDAFATSDALILPEQGGDSIVALINFNGALRALQKQRLWTLLGQPPWDGSDVILSADGIGCVAPRSVVQDGNYLYFVGLFGDIPTVFRWDGGGVKFSTTGGSAITEGEGHLVRLTAKIDPTMKGIPRSRLHKATSAIYGENLFVSTAISGDTVNDGTIAINLRTGAVSLQSFEAGLFHNGRAAGDSGQVYFTSVSDSGWVYLFGKDSTDIGSTAIVPIYESGWLDLDSPTLNKQGYRLWSRHARANTTGTGTWSTRWDFSGSDATTFNISTTTGEREENSYLGVGALGKRVKFRFTASPGVNATFRLGGIKFKFALRGEAL